MPALLSTTNGARRVATSAESSATCQSSCHVARSGRSRRSSEQRKLPVPGNSRAGATGLEPATSGVTGRRSNQLNYAPRAVRLYRQVARRSGAKDDAGDGWRISSAIGLIALLALRGGFRRGFVTGVLSLAGLVVGAIVGARLAPALLGGSAARYGPLVALVGAMILATFGQAFGVIGGRWLRRASTLSPLRALDNVGGGSSSEASPGSRSAGPSGPCCSTYPARRSCAGTPRSRRSSRP